jgi:DNA-binding Xre family transcriptional regulator
MKIRFDRKKLMAQMVERDIGVGELADKANISLSTLSGIRAGRSCTPKTAKALALALDVPIDRLTADRNGGEK